jgi:hypothetical protein
MLETHDIVLETECGRRQVTWQHGTHLLFIEGSRPLSPDYFKKRQEYGPLMGALGFFFRNILYCKLRKT